SVTMAITRKRKYGDFWELKGKLGKGLCALAEKSYTDALTEFETTISEAKRHKRGFEEILMGAQVAKGETYTAKKDYTQAIQFYEELASRGKGQSAQATGGAYVNLAKAYQARDKDDDKRKALRTYMQVTIYYAGAPEAYAEALYQTARLLEDEGKRDQAKAYDRELKKRCPDSSWAKKAR
ncbi:tol-pal system YbgF family protein, partial [Planctomycetota bacterium]